MYIIIEILAGIIILQSIIMWKYQRQVKDICRQLSFLIRCHRFVISLPCNVPTTSFCYLSSYRYCFLLSCYIISSHERFSIMTLYKNDKFFLVFLSIISVFLLPASNTPPCEHAIRSLPDADIRSRLLYGFFGSGSYGSGCPFLFPSADCN